MTECQHDWRDITGVKDPHEETVVLMCDNCDHLWLPDYDAEPPSVPWLPYPEPQRQGGPTTAVSAPD